MKKMIEEGSKEWNRLYKELECKYLPPISPCPDCGGPSAYGIICLNCEKDN